MRTWDKLTIFEKVQAKARARLILIQILVDGFVDIKLSSPNNQRMLVKILADMRKKDRGHLAAGMLTAHVGINSELEKLSSVIAQGSKYDRYANSII